MVIEGDHIASVEPTATPADSRLVRGRGKFLIPGLWDMHVHLVRRKSIPIFLAFGVTGVQDMGSDFARVSAWRAAIETGKAIGPRIVTPGPPVTEKPSGDPQLPILMARTPEEARAAFDQLWDMDVDFVKVLTASRATPISLSLNRPGTGTCVWKATSRGRSPRAEAINARQRSLEHLFGVMKSVSTDDEALNLFEKCALDGVRIPPTLVLWQRMAHTIDDQLKTDPRLKYVPESIRKTWPDLKDENAEPFKKQIKSIYRLMA